MEVDCGVDLAADGGLAVSRVLVCCLSFCLESSYGSLREPISPAGTGVLCCCGEGEDPRAISQREEKKNGSQSQMMKDF